MNIFDKNFKEILSTQIVSIAGGLIAGTILAAYTKQIFLIPGIFVILPGLLEMRNNLSGSFAARLSSGLFLGVVNPNKLNTKATRGNFMASFLLALVTSIALGLIAFLVNIIFFHTNTPIIILIPIITGLIANAIEIPMTLVLTFYFFKKGHDPNNIMGPFITSIGDIISIVSLLITLIII